MAMSIILNRGMAGRAGTEGELAACQGGHHCRDLALGYQHSA